MFASDYPGAAEFDADQPFPVIRHPRAMLLPTPAVARRAAALVGEYDCTAAWFGAAAPLALMAPSLRRAGVQRIVATTHGHEVAWTLLPGARAALRRIGTTCDVVTYLGEYTRRRLAPSLGPNAVLGQLTPGVDITRFDPAVSGSAVRDRYGLGQRPVIICVSRLVPRKGQDALIRALPAIRARVPEAALLIVGSGPFRTTLERLVTRTAMSGHVVFTGAVDEAELPAHFAAGDVFAMPCRTRRAGADVEGLGIVYLEASATGLPAVAGNSGGAPDAIRAGRTGYVVDGRDTAAIADAITGLLLDPALGRRMGQTGREWVEQSWQWQTMADRLRGLLEG